MVYDHANSLHLEHSICGGLFSVTMYHFQFWEQRTMCFNRTSTRVKSSMASEWASVYVQPSFWKAAVFLRPMPQYVSLSVINSHHLVQASTAIVSCMFMYSNWDHSSGTGYLHGSRYELLEPQPEGAECKIPLVARECAARNRLNFYFL